MPSRSPGFSSPAWEFWVPFSPASPHPYRTMVTLSAPPEVLDNLLGQGDAHLQPSSTASFDEYCPALGDILSDLSHECVEGRIRPLIA